MKGKGIYGACILLLVLSTSCQNGTKLTDRNIDTIKQEVLQVHRAIVEAAENRDADAMFEHILDSEETVIQTGDFVQTRREALESIRQSFQRFDQIQYHFTEKQLTVLSATSVEMMTRGRSNDILKSGRALETSFTQEIHFVLTDDGWKIQYAHHIPENL